MQLCSKGDGDITVSDLSEKAQINRSTFYLHYSDVNAVIEDIENETEIQVCAFIDKIDINALYESAYATYTCIFDRLNENADFLNYILNSKSVIERLKEIITEKTMRSAMRDFKGVKAEALIFPITFLVSGTVDCFVKWEQSDKSVPAEELIETLTSLTRQTIKYIKNLSE